jgi:hypothetical protein
MDTQGILAELKAEIDRLDQAIDALSGSPGGRRNAAGAARIDGTRRRRRPLSAAAKKRISAAMKKAWAKRKRTFIKGD